MADNREPGSRKAINASMLRRKNKAQVLHERGYSSSDIAQILEISRQGVELFIKSERLNVPDPMLRQEWKDDAACAGADPELFHPTKTGLGAVKLQEMGIELCGSCPVIDTCREYAISHLEQHGVWGGINFADVRYYQGADNASVEVSIPV